MRTTIVLASCLALALVACGGGKKSDTTVSSGGGEYEEGGQSVEDPCAGGMCPPEVLDNIQYQLDHKRTAAARCRSRRRRHRFRSPGAP